MCPTGTPPSMTSPPTSGIRRVFDVIDADHDGKISPADLYSFYSSTASAAAADDDHVISAMITAADFNRDGYVQYDEFQRVLDATQKAKGQIGNGLMEEAFRVIDKDGDGVLGYDDLKSYLNGVGVTANDEEIRAMMKLDGGDLMGGVGFDGFMKILALHDDDLIW